MGMLFISLLTVAVSRKMLCGKGLGVTSQCYEWAKVAMRSLDAKHGAESVLSMANWVQPGLVAREEWSTSVFLAFG